MSDTGRAAPEKADRIVTWGMGGADRTLTGLTAEKEREVISANRAWGPVRIRHEPGDVPRWASNGHPLPEENITRKFLTAARSPRNGTARARREAPARTTRTRTR